MLNTKQSIRHWKGIGRSPFNIDFSQYLNIFKSKYWVDYIHKCIFFPVNFSLDKNTRSYCSYPIMYVQTRDSGDTKPIQIARLEHPMLIGNVLYATLFTFICPSMPSKRSLHLDLICGFWQDNWQYDLLYLPVMIINKKEQFQPK